MRTIFLTIITAALVLSSAWALPEGFKELTQKVVETAPARLQALAQADAYKAQTEGLDKRYWPQVSVQSGYQQSNSPTTVFMQKLNQRDFAASDFGIGQLNHPGFHGDWGSSVSVGGLIWENGSLSWQKRAMEKLSKAKSLEGDVLTGAVLVRWSDLYMQTLQTQMTLDGTRENLKALQGDLADAQKLEDQGVVLGADVAMAKAAEQGLQAKVASLEGQLAGLKAQLKELSGQSVDELSSIELKADLKTTEDATHLSVVSAQLASDAAQAQVTASKRNSDLQLKWVVSEEFHTSGSANGAATTAYVGASWNLFDPQKSSRVAMALAQKRASEAALTATKRAHEKQHDELVAELNAIKQQLPQMDTMVAQLEKSLEMTQQLYKEGRKSIADVAELRQKIAEATTQRNGARAAFVGTQVALEENNGTLTLERYLTLWN